MGGSVCHLAGQGRIKYATMIPIRHLPNLFFQASALDFLQPFSASPHISLLCTRNFFYYPSFTCSSSLVLEEGKTNFHLYGSVLPPISPLQIKQLNSFSPFLTGRVSYSHFLLLWAQQIHVGVCLCLIQLRWQSCLSAGQPDSTVGGSE